MVVTFLKEVLAKEIFEAKCDTINIDINELATVRNALRRLVPIMKMESDSSSGSITPASCTSSSANIQVLDSHLAIEK